jgi:release factor glutamine methyltransferase
MTSDSGTTRRALQDGLARRLGSKSEARWIVEELLGTAASVPAHVGAAADDLARRRLAGEPLQYVLGHWAFRTLDLLVDPRVLIPRPETEQVAEVALGELERVAAGRPGAVVVDLGTGSGAIALALATECRHAHPSIRVWATDVDPGALEVATVNRQRVGAGDPGAAERVVLRRGSWWQALPSELHGRVDLAVSNPPYVAEAEWPGLDAEVRAEPYRALVAPDGTGGTPGLADVEAVVAGSPAWLAPRASLVVEIAPHQSAAAEACARAVGFDDVAVVPDLSGRPRVLVARR